MARKKQSIESDPLRAAKVEAKILELLCLGHDAGTVSEQTGVDYREVCRFRDTAYALEVLEHARQRRLAAAGATAEAQQAEWAEHDRQERESATAIHSAIIRLIPRDAASIGRMGGKGGDLRMAIDECDKLASSLLKAQKARRIASNRPVEKTEVDTTDHALMAELEAFRAELRGEDDGGSDSAADGLPAAQPTDQNSTQP
jgi:hypothetical protein